MSEGCSSPDCFLSDYPMAVAVAGAEAGIAVGMTDSSLDRPLPRGSTVRAES